MIDEKKILNFLDEQEKDGNTLLCNAGINKQAMNVLEGYLHAIDEFREFIVDNKE